jgi:urea transport system permease protein
MLRNLITRLALGLTALFLMPVGAAPTDKASLTDAELIQVVHGLVAESRATILKSIHRLGELADPRALPALQALRDGKLKAAEDGTAVIIEGDAGRHALSGEPLDLTGHTLRTPVINNAVRRALVPVIAQLQLRSPDAKVRLTAAQELAKRPREEAVQDIEQALAQESDRAVREALGLALAQTQLSSTDANQRLEAVALLGASGNLNLRSTLQSLLQKRPDGEWVEPDERVRKAAEQALSALEHKQLLIAQTGNLFYGLSLGSVLLLAALGLAITFGLMGVINMAHGEMLMLGAYSTYVVQGLFRDYLPHLFDGYVLAAIPVAFLVPALVGMALERGVIRHLYGRPLETLLATWGISLLLIQSVRLVFGAQNVEVANPAWLSGGMEVMQGVVVPYSRLAIIVFTVLVVGLVWVLLQRTRLGLQVRAVTQSRSMAAALGISTARVDMWTFGLGSGVAGLGGVALSQLGNVGPELGQFYIVDSFMVVVLGGVGKIAGTVVAALGLGMVNKFLEPVSGAVLAKIMVLGFIVLLIQKRPQGIFALKGRLAES